MMRNVSLLWGKWTEIEMKEDKQHVVSLQYIQVETCLGTSAAAGSSGKSCEDGSRTESPQLVHGGAQDSLATGLKRVQLRRGVRRFPDSAKFSIETFFPTQFRDVLSWSSLQCLLKNFSCNSEVMNQNQSSVTYKNLESYTSPNISRLKLRNPWVVENCIQHFRRTEELFQQLEGISSSENFVAAADPWSCLAGWLCWDEDIGKFEWEGLCEIEINGETKGSCFFFSFIFQCCFLGISPPFLLVH